MMRALRWCVGSILAIGACGLAAAADQAGSTVAATRPSSAPAGAQPASQPIQVTLSVRRSAGRLVAGLHPGEWIFFVGTIHNGGSELLAVPVKRAFREEPEFSPNNVTIFLRTPDGKEYGFDPSGNHLNGAEPAVTLPADLDVLTPNDDLPCAASATRLCEVGPRWFDVKTRQPATPSLAALGEYVAWMVVQVRPGGRSNFIGPRTWSGTVESPRVRFTVADLPVDKRIMTPTAEQAALIKWIARGRPLNRNEIATALSQTENEGFAIALLQAARADADLTNDLLSLVADRAIPDGAGKILCDGPYLKAYCELMLDIGEGKVRGTGERSAGLIPYDVLLRPVTQYVRSHPEEKAIHDRLKSIATTYGFLQNASDLELGKESPTTHQQVASRPTTAAAWQVMIDLDVLRPGNMAWYPEFLLGNATQQSDGELRWMVPSTRTLTAELVATLKDGKVSSYAIRRVRQQPTKG